MLGNSKCDTMSEYLVFATRTEIRSVSLDQQSTNMPFKPIVSSNIVLRYNKNGLR